jgi:hypothetical protein
MTSPYLLHPLRSEAQARADRRRRKLEHDSSPFAPVLGLLNGMLLSVAGWVVIGLVIYKAVMP